MTNSFDKFLKRLVFLIVILFCSYGYSQSFIITYPNSPEDATACNDGTLLTVRMNVVEASTTGAQVTIDLADGMEYELGSLLKTDGTPTLTITENGGTGNQPNFTIDPANLVTGDFIEFTILRSALCSAYDNVLLGTVFKDKVIGDINGIISEEESTPYTINFPSLTFVQPPALNDGLIGETRSRDFSITNGADGCANAVHFSIDYTGGGISPQSLTLGGATISPSSVVGTTYHYSISGALLTADGQLCNGETLTFTETITINSCEPFTNYNTGWGCAADVLEWCTVVAGTGNVNMASGQPDFASHTNTKIGFVDMCTPFQLETTFENEGTGHMNAATMYNVELLKGKASGSFELLELNSNYTLSNATIKGLSVPWVYTGGKMTVTLEDFFTVDPDGAGIGLDDIDGDGFFDDLPKDSEVTLLMDVSIGCDLTCGEYTVTANVGGAMNYTTMCSSTVVSTNRRYGSGESLGYTLNTFVPNGYLPPNVENVVPFRARLSVGFFSVLDDFETADSRYVYELTLPPGVSVSGTGNVEWTYGEYPAVAGGPVSIGYTQVGNLVTITSPDKEIGYAHVDLVYDCSASPSLAFDYKLRKINNITTGCSCQDEYACGSFLANASCPSVCTDGPSSSIPVVRRADNSLGWTDDTMSTKQIASNISAYDLSKALYLDEIEIYGNAIQNGSSNTLGAQLSVLKPNSSTNALTPLNIDVTITRGGSSIASGNLSSFSMANSTSSEQIINWDMNALIPAGGLLDGDEIQTISRYQVTSNSMKRYDVQYGREWFFYNTNPVDSSLEYCNFFTPEMYLVATGSVIGTNSYRTYGCEPNSLGTSTNYLARRFDASGTNYSSEYRPVMYVESIEAIIPDGYDLIEASIDGVTVIVPDIISGNTYTFINPGTWPGVGLTVKNSYGRRYPFKVRATCSTEDLEPITFNFNIKDYYYHYAENDPTSTAYDITMVNLRNIAHYEHPEIVMSNLTGDIQASNTIESYTVRMTNPALQDAPFTWLAINDVSNVQIESVTDVSTGLEIPPNAYPGGKLYHLGTAGISSDEEKDYRIDFSYTSCSQTTIKVLGGWNCDTYPLDPNLDTCSKEELDLIFTPESGEVEIISVVEPTAAIDLCEALDYEFHINSSQSGNITDNQFTILAPQGMNPISGNFEAEYPVGSGNWEVIPLLTNVGSSYSYDLTVHTQYPVNGLPGTLNDGGDANIRLMAVKFQMTSGCNFVAGSNFQVSTTANNVCGTAALGSTLESQTVSTNVAGVTADYSVISTMNLLSGDFDNCGTPVLLEGDHTVITPSPLGPNGIVEIELPEGYLYTASSYNCTSLICATFVGVTTNVNGREVIRLAIPAGTDSGDQFTYTIEVTENTSNFISCGNKTIQITSQDEAENISCVTEASGFCPVLPVQTGAYDFDFSVDRASLNLSATSTTATLSATNEALVANFEIENNSSFDIPIGAKIEAFFDANQNGTYDIGESVLGSKTLTTGITSGNTVAENLSFTIPASQVCNVLIGVRTSENFCFCTDVFEPMAIPASLNGVAGTDKDVCEMNDSVGIGDQIPGYTYQWAGASPVETAYLDNTLSSNPIFSYSGPKLTTALDLTYTVTVIRPNGCQSTDTMTVTIAPSPAVVVFIADASCGQDNGTISFTFDDYADETHIEFSLDDASTFESQVSDSSGRVNYTNLAPGTYDLWARWGDDSCPIDLGAYEIGIISEVVYTTQPIDDTVIVGNDGQFFVNVQNADTYQWQVSTDNGVSFAAVADGSDYSGTQTTVLTVLKPELEKNNYQYRLLSSNSNTPLCDPIPSESAVLIVHVASVITNRRITHRVKKN